MKISDIVQEARQREMVKIEKYIQAAIKPKPKWLPTFIWHWILSKILILRVWEKKTNDPVERK